MARVAKDKTSEETVNKEEASVIVENKVLKDKVSTLTNEIETLKEMISTMNQNNKNGISNYQSKKISVISLIPNTYILSTEENGSGKVYKFPHYGYSHKIKYDDLEQIVHLYREQAECGYFYIDDKNAVREFGLEDEYENILNKGRMDKLIRLEDSDCVDAFINMNDDMREHIIDSIIENMKTGYNYDFNYLKQIKDETGIDIYAKYQNLNEIQKNVK